MPDFAVSIAIRSDDQMSANLRRLDKSTKRFGRNAEKSFGRAAKSASMFKSVLGGMVIGNAVTGGIMAVQRGVSATVESFVDLDHALTSAAAKFGGYEKGSQVFERLNAKAKEIGATTEFTAKQAGEGLEFLAMAGFNANAAMAALPITVDLATASNTDLARATDIASDALGAFGMDSADAAEQANNLRKIVDVFAATTSSANVDMENMFETMKQAGPIMTSAGQSMESFAAMTGIMGNAGIKGSLAGTTLKNTITRLVAPVGKAKKVLKQLNVEIEDQDGNMRDVADILTDFAKSTSKMGNAQRSAAISTVFGARAISGISTILDKGIPTLEEYRASLEGAEGASERMANQMRTSLENKLKTLQSALLDVGFRVIEAFQQAFPGAIDKAIEAVRNFDVRPIIDQIKSFLEIVKTVFGFLRDNWDIIKILGETLIALKLAIEIVTVAQWAWNVAMMANPIGLIMAAIIALIAIIILLAVHWDDVKAAWNSTMDDILGGTNEVVNSIIKWWAKADAAIYGALDGIIDHFREMWQQIVNLAALGISKLVGLVGKVGGFLGFDVSGLPSAKDIGDAMGAGDFVPTRSKTAEEYEDLYQAYAKDFAESAKFAPEEEFRGARKGGIQAPNFVKEEASQQSLDFRGEIEVFGLDQEQSRMSSETRMNGVKLPDIDWKAKAGRN